jgi:SAM-dependent methyltransferase
MLETALLEFEVLIKCPICGHAEIPILTNIYDMNIRSSYCNCQNCGQLFLNPRMTDEQTTTYYAGMYRDGLTDNIPRFMERDTLLQKSRAEAQLPFIYSTLPKGFYDHLDIGTSLGHLMYSLNWLRNYDDSGIKFCSEGVEPDTRYHAYEPANRFKIYTDVADIPEGKTYDFITMSHSLEHLNHPREFLTDLLAKHAHAGTIVMIDVPNTELHRGAFRIHHPYAFTPFTLQGLFARIGWATVQMSFYGLAQEGPEKKYMLGFFKRGS